MTMFSRASDSGTSSMTEAGISISLELDERQAVLFGLGLHDVVGVGVAQLDQGVLDGAPRPAGFLELIGADHPAADEDFGPIPTLGHDLTTPEMIDSCWPETENGRAATGASGARQRPLRLPHLLEDGESASGIT